MKLQRLRELALGVECWPHTNKTIFPSPAYDFQQACTPANILPILESYEELLALLKVSACPICDGQGAFYDGHGQVCQCQFCDERAKAITNAEKLSQ